MVAPGGVPVPDCQYGPPGPPKAIEPTGSTPITCGGQPSWRSRVAVPKSEPPVPTADSRMSTRSTSSSNSSATG
ncbi:Uncharacterised protein [Mycobacteroides abscessus subsp. abscessus]|nr:Uncharacterised protein [Mycobacteroides abscessus subsp. abscessus]